MSEVSKIQLPDNTVVDIKDARIPGVDNVPTSGSSNLVKSGGVYSALLSPSLKHVAYEGFTSSSSYSVHCGVYFRPDDWDKMCSFRFRVHAYVPSEANVESISDITVQCYHGAVKSYYIMNGIADTSNYAYYSLYYYGVTEAGHTAGAQGYFGVYINSANCWSYTTKRQLEYDLIHAEGCTVGLFTTDKNSADARQGYASGNFASSVKYNTYTAGLQETGDSNTTYSIISNDELRTGTATSSRTVSAARLAANYSITTDSTTGVKTVNIAGISATIPEEVEANPTVPSGTTPSSLTGLKVGSDYYDVSAGSSDAVLYTSQSLTESQQMQARKNQGLYYESNENNVINCASDSTIASAINGGSGSEGCIVTTSSWSDYRYLYRESSANIEGADIVSIYSTEFDSTELAVDDQHTNYDVVTSGPSYNPSIVTLYVVKEDNTSVNTPDGNFILDIGIWLYGGYEGATIDPPINTITYTAKRVTKVESKYLPIATSITSQSTDEEVPSAKTVYDTMEVLSAVQYTQQELTDAQKKQARLNQGLYYSEPVTGTTITWDGDDTGLANFDLGGIAMFKVASGPLDTPLSVLSKSIVTVNNNGVTETFKITNWTTSIITSDTGDWESGTITQGYSGNYYIFILKDAVLSEGSTAMPDGIYFYKQTEYVSSLTIPDYDNCEYPVPFGCLDDVAESVSSTSTNYEVVTPKAVYDFVKPVSQSSQPVGGMLPGVLYNLSVLTGSVTIEFASPVDSSVANEYAFTFSTSSTAPTITWPNSIVAWVGNCVVNYAPVISVSRYYEVSVLNGIAVIVEVAVV